jgi:hypothetical protein
MIINNLDRFWAMESFHTKSSQTTTRPQISMKVGELADSIEKRILAKFQHPMSCSFCGTGVQILKIALFGMLLH